MTDSVLVVSAISPLPVDNGRRVFLCGLLRYLSDRYDENNVHYALAAPADVPLPSLPGNFYRLPVPGVAEKLWNVGAHSVVQGRLTLQEALLSSRALQTSLRRLVDRVQPDVEFYDTIRIGQHRLPSRSGGRQILHLDDLYSVRYTRMLDASAAQTTTIDPLGQFAAAVPGAFRKFARNPAIYRRLLSWEASRLAQRERSIVHDFDMSTLVNSSEVETLQRESPTADVRLITPLAVVPQRVAREPSERPDFLFLGRLNVPHNDDAICAFLTDVLPALVALRPDARITIVGGGVGTNLQDLASRFRDNVYIEGFVEDLDPYFVRATAVIAPLRFGSGVKQKVLDALIRGVPVVGTGVALEGIPVDSSSASGCTVEDDFSRWPEALVRLIDPDVNAASSAAAAADGVRLYSEDHIYQQYDTIFQPDSVTPSVIDLRPEARKADGLRVGGASADHTRPL